jgi:hypothetical protein
LPTFPSRVSFTIAHEFTTPLFIRYYSGKAQRFPGSRGKRWPNWLRVARIEKDVVRHQTASVENNGRAVRFVFTFFVGQAGSCGVADLLEFFDVYQSPHILPIKEATYRGTMPRGQ